MAACGVLVSVFVVSVSVAGTMEVAGIELDDRAELGASELVLNGAGLRKRVLFKVYVAGLYVTEKRKSPTDVFALAGPKRVAITLLRNLPARKLVDGLMDGVRDNSSPEEQQAVMGRLEELTANLLALRQGSKGDVITFDWLPDEGTRVVVNGEVMGDAIPGDDVYRALLRVWLGDRPTSSGLKKALLGQTD